MKLRKSKSRNYFYLIFHHKISKFRFLYLGNFLGSGIYIILEFSYYLGKLGLTFFFPNPTSSRTPFS